MVKLNNLKIIPVLRGRDQVLWYNYIMDDQPIPSDIARYFWGDDLRELNVSKNQKYIIQTLLETGNSEALKWLFSTIDKQTIKNFLPALRLSEKSAHFWKIYLS